MILNFKLEIDYDSVQSSDWCYLILTFSAGVTRVMLDSLL